MTTNTTQSILDLTLASAVRDRQMARPDGSLVRRLIEGVHIKPLTTQVDGRGWITELYDPRWNWHAEDLVFAYTFSIRPGFVKGWNLHKEHEDRYALIQGDMEVVLYDPRPESSTYGDVCRIVLSEHQRSIVNIPRNVWHADHNIGSKDLVVVNFPTSPYDHANPDKYRLPIDTDLIPYSFGDAKGW